MKKFLRTDPLVDVIKEYYQKLLYSQIDRSDVLAIWADKSRNVFERVSASLRLIDFDSSNVKGYLDSYDLLYSLGFDGDSLDILHAYLNRNGFHPLVASRLLVRYVNSCQLGRAVRFFDSYSDLIIEDAKLNEKTRQTLISLFSEVGDFSRLALIGVSFEETWKAERIRIVNELNLLSLDEQLDFIFKKIDEGRYEEADWAIWSAYSMGSRQHGFYERLTCVLPYETASSRRVAAFSHEAYNLFPTDSGFIDLAIQASLHRGELYEAQIILLKSLALGCKSREIALHALRMQALSGSSISFGLHGDLDQEVEKVLSINSIRRWGAWDQRVNGLYDELGLPAGGMGSDKIIKKSFNFYVPSPTPSVAICISGQILGNLDDLSSNIKTFKKNVDADVYLDTWDQASLTSVRFSTVERLLGRELTNVLPFEARSRDGFRRILPNTLEALISPVGYSVDEESLKKCFDFASIRLESAGAFEDLCSSKFPGLRLHGTFNQAKMFYKIWSSFEQVKEFEKRSGRPYDVVVRMRPDNLIELEGLSSIIESCAKGVDIAYVNYLVNLGIGDRFAIGSRSAMEIYSSIWPLISSKNSFIYNKIIDRRANLGAEILMGNHLAAFGVDVAIVKPKKDIFINKSPINVIDIKDAIEKDSRLDTGFLIKDFEKFYNDRSSLKNFVFS